jgi:DNA-binding NarL/FixJ family response regulator
MLREGIAALIGNQSDMQLIGEASNGREAVERRRFDLAVHGLRLVRIPRPRVERLGRPTREC